MSSSYSIGPVRFSLGDGIVTDESGTERTLRPKTAAVLRYLAERGEQLVSRDELLDAIWPGTHVTENGLSQCVTEIRRAFGPHHGLLRSLPRRGYVLSAKPRPSEPGHSDDAEPTLADRSGCPAVAVLPFSHDPLDPMLGRFADVLLDALVGALAAIREPIVISANSTRQLSMAGCDPSDLARRLGADYLATGVLRRYPEHVFLSIEVAAARRGAVLWHRTYTLAQSSLIEPPHELASAIAQTLAPRVREHELRVSRATREHDVAAYTLMLEANALMLRLDATVFEKAGELLREACALDPGFAPARAAIGTWYSLRIGQGWSSDREADTRALISEVQHALELDGVNGRAMALLGHTYGVWLHDFEAAQDLISRAIAAAPNDADARVWATPTLAYVGRTKEAIENAEHAIRLSPEDPLKFRYEHFLALAHYQDGNFEEAVRWGKSSARKQPNYLSNLGCTIASLGALGRAAEAAPLVARCMRQLPGYRVMARISQYYPDPRNRQQYAEHLIAGGLPP